MSKATITIEDTEDGKGVDVRIVFDPPLEKGRPGTQPEYFAIRFLELMKRETGEGE